MKREKGKETFSIIVSVILALGLFLFLLAGLCGLCGYCRFGSLGRDADDLAGAEVGRIQSGVGIADGLDRHTVEMAEAIERLAGSDGVERLAVLAFVGAGNAQGTADVDLVIASRIETDDVCLADTVHAGDGVEALAFLDGVQKICLVFLCVDAQAARSSQQQGKEGAFHCFHSDQKSFGC